MSEIDTPAAQPPRVAVIGPSQATEAQLDAAERCGRLLAQAGAVVVTGGLGGVMAAASRGAASAGGLTVGILPTRDATTANPWVAVPVATGIGEMRNALVVASAQAVLAVGLSWGTLSEIALAMAGGRPVIALDVEPLPLDGVVHSDSPEHAVREALARVERSG